MLPRTNVTGRIMLLLEVPAEVLSSFSLTTVTVAKTDTMFTFTVKLDCNDIDSDWPLMSLHGGCCR